MKKQKSELLKINSYKNQKVIGSYNSSEYFQPAYDFSQLSELYKLNSYHQRCINVKAGITAGLGYELIPSTGEALPDESEKISKLINNIDKKIDSDFLSMLVKLQIDYEIFGNAWIEIIRNLKGDIIDLAHIPAEFVRIRKEDKNIAVMLNGNERKEFISFGSPLLFGYTEFIQIKNYDPASNVYGLPEYISALNAMLLDRNALDYNINRINNRTTPEALITITGTELTNSQRDEIVDFFGNNFNSSENAGRLLLIQNKNKDANIQLKEVKTTLLDSVFRNLRKETRDEIISVHGVPPRLVGVVSGGQLGGMGEVKEQNRIFREIVIAPRKARLEYHFNNILSFGLGIKSYKLRFREYDISDNIDDAKYAEILLKNKIISTEEARNMLIR